MNNLRIRSAVIEEFELGRKSTSMNKEYHNISSQSLTSPHNLTAIMDSSLDNHMALVCFNPENPPTSLKNPRAFNKASKKMMMGEV